LESGFPETTFRETNMALVFIVWLHASPWKDWHDLLKAIALNSSKDLIWSP
jgi:hypothetical protein